MLNKKKLETNRIDNLTISSSIVVQAALDLGLKCELLPEKAVRVSKGKTSYYLRGTTLPCNDAAASKLSDNKLFTRYLLNEAGISTPQTLILKNPNEWKKVLKQKNLLFPLVVKPLNAAHGHGITIKIMSLKTFEKAVIKAFSFTIKEYKEKKVLVEEYFSGRDLRFLVVGNKIASVLERRPAYVVGNGKNNLRELISAFNREWKSQVAEFDLPMCPILVDSELTRKLKQQKLTLNYMPQSGKKVILRWNANVSTGGRPFDVTDEVHPALKTLALKCAKTMKLQVAGVDMLCKNLKLNDISHKNLCVLEVNDEPGLDIHKFPYRGKSRDVGRDIIKYIFKIK
ncbi:MAG: hypothetical protein ABH835_02700 [Patescibacteria group bacterium]